MLEQDDLWLLEEPPIDEPSELFSIPEIRRHLVADRVDDEVGLRALLERPEVLARPWWGKGIAGKRRRKIVKSTKRQRRWRDAA
jgi:hypothetical protein